MRAIVKRCQHFATRRLRAILLYFEYLMQYVLFQRELKKHSPRFRMRFSDQWPCLYDRTATTTFDRHYVFHTAWAARCVRKINPEKHVDIASSLFFCAIVSAFVPIEFFDYRPVDLGLTQLSSGGCNLLDLPFPSEGVLSLSCMHVIEHVGLGRYGEPFDIDGDLKAIKELQRVLAVGGNLLFVVPLAYEAMIMFNAHRVYTHEQIIYYFLGFQLVEFALIQEESKGGPLLYGPNIDALDGQKYACGCYWFLKL